MCSDLGVASALPPAAASTYSGLGSLAWQSAEGLLRLASTRVPGCRAGRAENRLELTVARVDRSLRTDSILR